MLLLACVAMGGCGRSDRSPAADDRQQTTAKKTELRSDEPEPSGSSSDPRQEGVVDAAQPGGEPPRTVAAPPADREDPTETEDPTELRELAMTALDSGETDRADRLIRASLKKSSNDPDSVFFMAVVLSRQNRYPEAIKMLDDLAEAVPAVRLPVLGQTAEWMVTFGRWNEAEARYKTLLKAVPDARPVHRQLARLLMRQGRRSEAVTHLDTLCRQGDIEELELRSLLMLSRPMASDSALDDLEPIGTLGKARAAMASGDLAAAGELSRQEGSDAPDIAALRGRIDAESEDFAALRRWTEQSAKTANQNSADYWFAMGTSHSANGDHSAAVRCFCETVLLDQTDRQAYVALSRSLAKIDASKQSELAAMRAEMILRTQALGKEMADRPDRNVDRISKLATLLDQLQRPFEALSWRAIAVIYASRTQPQNQSRDQMQKINESRISLLKEGDEKAAEEFVVCGVDVAALRTAAGQAN